MINVFQQIEILKAFFDVSRIDNAESLNLFSLGSQRTVGMISHISWVGGCIHRLYIQSRWMHPPTLVLESVDASTDSVHRVGGCIDRLCI